MLVNGLFLGDSLFICMEKAFVRKWIVPRYGNVSVNVLVTVMAVNCCHVFFLLEN